MEKTKLVTYSIPNPVPRNKDFLVNVRTPGGDWKELDVLLVKVDMHDVREAAMASFDFCCEVEVEVISQRNVIQNIDIRPHSAGVLPDTIDQERLRFTLKQPQKLSIEINGDRFHNLHLFAKEIQSEQPDPQGAGVVVIDPGIHRTEMLVERLKSGMHTLYFKPGMHHIEQVLLNIPSGMSVYLAGGAVLVGSLVCDGVADVKIFGRGFIYLADFGRFSAFRGVRIMYSKDIEVSGIAVIDPPHYSIYLGQSERVRIRDFESFSTRGWSDGIDMMSCCDVEIDNVFMRNSDDCIAIYGHRWGYYGDAKNITVKNSVLWADVAHPTMIGTHGDYHGEGTLIENILFENIDILEHHEPQDGYRGCLTINAGDKNIVRHVTYRNIRIDPFELGRIIDIRVIWNPDYNPVPGNGIEHVEFDNIRYRGSEDVVSSICGFDEDRSVKSVLIKDFYRNGVKITGASEGKVNVGSFVSDVRFE
ncbi:glycosyl hydrolase family 28 protein [Paenibacillus sp. HWE-109]|uniref:glycosyl hydrolase family 28 protein n=1 Tax=Paenibacillus sp. HWE-109 TaxID=1306526 RepID=UPI001EDE7DEE|nr:glycosyl hydrolase family 28 protein [Paenibacillus sp. HWE-109]UKS28232.1 glycosyl hydrolase family 28 protein [Paenibacillus sp. HWE-109]